MSSVGPGKVGTQQIRLRQPTTEQPEPITSSLVGPWLVKCAKSSFKMAQELDSQLLKFLRR